MEELADNADASLKSAVWNTRKITAHHAIVPTGEAPDSLKPAERSLYELIATAFCLQFFPAMRYEAQKISVSIADTTWETTGRHVLDAGWTRFIGNDPDEQDEEQSLPSVEQGDAVQCRDVQTLRKKTSPPSKFSEGSLIEAMANVHLFVNDAQAKVTLKESKGIGTEATRANILETQKERGYLVADKKVLVSTALGQHVIDVTPPSLKDPITTAVWEDRLEAIAQGKETLNGFLAEQIRVLPDLLAPILGDGKPVFPCPDCGAALHRRTSKKDGSYFWGCSAYPACKTILPDANGKPGAPRPKAVLSAHVCKACGKPLVERSSARGPFYGCSGYPNCKTIYPVGADGAPDFNVKAGGKK